MIKQIVKNETELIDLGVTIGSCLAPGTIVLLSGPLGSGKTTITKGIAKGLGITKKITSPTYTIIKEYEQKLCHIDAYRIENEELGIDEYLSSGYIVCIEWHQNLEIKKNEHTVEIILEYLEDGRKITIVEGND